MRPARGQRIRRSAALLLTLGLWVSLTGAADPDSPRLLDQTLNSQSARQFVARIVAAPPSVSAPYQSARAFLQAQGLVNHTTTTWTALDTLPAAGNSLMLLDRQTPLSTQQVDQLLDWVRRGGRLLALADALWDEASATSGDALLDRLQIRVQLSAQLPQLPPAADDKYPSLTKLYLEDEEAPAYFSFDTQRHLDDPTGKVQAWANSNGATHLMQMAYGDGLITLVSDAQLWKREQIQRYDNAWLLWYLNQGSEVTWLFEPVTEVPKPYMPWVLAALLLAAGSGLWWIATRRRAPQGSSLLDRHELHLLREHGRRCLREQGPHSFLGTLRRDVLQRACLHHPGFDTLAVAEQWQVLAQLSQNSTRSIGAALMPAGRQRLSSRAFTHAVAQLQSLRDSLGPMSIGARTGHTARPAAGQVDETMRVVLDCSAWAGHPQTDLKHAVHACLYVSEAALADGYAVGLQVSSCASPVSLMAQSGAAHLQRLSDALAHLQPSATRADSPATLDSLLADDQALTLLVMVAGLPTDDEPVWLPALCRIAGRYPVLLASLRDEALERQRQQPVGTRREALVYCGVMQRLLWRQGLHDRLAAAGITVVDAWPGEVATEALLRYRSLRQSRA